MFWIAFAVLHEFSLDPQGNANDNLNTPSRDQQVDARAEKTNDPGVPEVEISHDLLEHQLCMLM